MPSYFPEEEGSESDLEQQNLIPGGNAQAEDDDRTPLDKTIDRIGMGSYQWILLSLCGFGACFNVMPDAVLRPRRLARG
ncbi:hypothetical protein H0H81_010548 [Sphagnurus paluster]|uniref:Uncharacterized protein n=1 Tax=Sphagnurus paluster TaxID=117069 RepID=A0A9P7FV87_9AGAR|nr:hypothetical protein H0H81_010548 [Sphagnurus paluster]